MNKEELLELIKTGEGYNLEFKKGFTNSIGREICAFANSTGGRILLGVDDDGCVVGHNSTNAEKSRIQDIARNMDPSFSVDITCVKGMTIISVPDGKDKPYAVHGHFYVRIGSNSQQLKREEILLFFQQQGHVKFDEQVNQKFKYETDFNVDAFDEFLRRAGIQPTISQDRMLNTMGFLKGKQMTNAGVLFFCKDVSRFFPNVDITCVLYQGDSKYKILDKKVFETDLISNYENAVAYLKNKLNTEYVIKTEREEFLELPEDALREAIVNAIAHRDYFSPSHIQVDIYKNSVDISNPASYPKHITIDDLLSGSHPKNVFLFSLMQRADLVEKIGSGIKRLNDAMEDYKLALPVIEYKNIWFRIVFERPNLQKNSYQQRIFGQKRDTVNDTLYDTVNDTQKKILKELEKNPAITYIELAREVDKSRITVIRQMNDLKEKGIIKRIGSDKTGHWEIVGGK